MRAEFNLYGNSKQEAMYPAYYVDAAKQKLDGPTVKFCSRALLIKLSPEPELGQFIPQ
jgi:hypothetical protein